MINEKNLKIEYQESYLDVYLFTYIKSYVQNEKKIRPDEDVEAILTRFIKSSEQIFGEFQQQYLLIKSLNIMINKIKKQEHAEKNAFKIELSYEQLQKILLDTDIYQFVLQQIRPGIPYTSPGIIESMRMLMLFTEWNEECGPIKQEKIFNYLKNNKQISVDLLLFIRKFIQEFALLFSSSFQQEDIHQYFQKQQNFIKSNMFMISAVFEIIQQLCENINVNF